VNARLVELSVLLSKARSYVWFALGLAVLAGCNRSGLDLAYVEGVVTYQGAPVAEAGVLFKPAQGPFASGATDEQGRFTLQTANEEGALIGDHTVTISKVSTTAKHIPGNVMPVYVIKPLIPQKYSRYTTSGLTATVKDDDNHFEFTLSGNLTDK
jgi:hypothetical protein